MLIDQEREAPALIYEDGMYYMVTSGCTGWAYNSALYARSEFLLGKWKLIDNPCEGERYRETYGGQCTYMFRVKEQIYIMFDHWIPDNLQNFRLFDIAGYDSGWESDDSVEGRI